MTDDELRGIILEKSPADLTPEECAALKQAIRRSPELLRELADRIRIDEYLAQALGRPQVSAERVFARLAARRRQAIGRWTPYGLAVCGVVVAVLAGLLAFRREGDGPRPQPVRPEAAAAVTPEETAAAAAPPEKPSAPPAAPEPATTPAPPAPAPVAAAVVPAAPLPVVGLFAAPGEADATPNEKSLATWFAAVDKLPLKLTTQQIEGKPCGRIEGVARLLRPLAPGAALRMHAADFSGVRIHVWSGARGITFDAFANPLQWQAYATERSGAGPIPASFVSLCRDDGRMIRTNPAGIHRVELRCEDGIVALVRGDVRLLEAPLAGPPTDVFFEGNASFRDLALVAAAPVPPLRTPAPRPAADLPPEFRERWLRRGDPAAGFTVHDDGTATLSVSDNKQPAWALLPLPETTGLREIVLRVEGIVPGTGVVFGDAGGNPQSVLMGLSNKNLPGVVQVQRKGPNDAAIESGEQITAQRLMLVKDSLWLRVRVCGGLHRIDMSADGTAWVTAVEPQPPFAAVGLHAVPHPSGRSITLAAPRVAPLPRLESLCPEDLRAAAVELPPQGPLSAWLAAADAARPPVAESGGWRRACALKALSGNAGKDLAVDLLGFLFRESLAMELPAGERRDLLDDILAVAPVADDAGAAARILALFDAAGARLAAAGGERPFTAISHDQLAAPLRSGQPLVVFPEPLVRREIVALLSRGEWQAAADVLERLAFFGFTAKARNEPLFRWAAAVARSRRDEKSAALAPEWRHPLQAAPSKESASVEAELNAALDAGDFADACRIIDAAAADGEVDLVRDRRDAGLLVSLPVLVATAMRDEPRLLAAMRQDRERIAGLRVLEATAAGSPAALEATTVQFHGTLAAAKAHLWLGDRSLAAGRFATAVRHYEAAAAAFPEDDVKQRERTAAAIEVARRLAQQDRAGAAAASVPPAVPQAAAVTATPQARLEGDVGGNPGGLPAPLAQGGVDWPPHAVDWVARQTALLPLSDRLLVSNRFQLASHDPASGAVQWRAGLGGDAANAHDLPGQPMRPLADATRAYVRRLRKAGPAVAAIARADGAVVWEEPSTPERQFVSDPVRGEGESLAIVVARKVEDSHALALLHLDTVTGRPLREAPLPTIGPGWNPLRDCQLADADGIFVVTAAGSVIACDGDGRVLWVRRDTWLPPQVDGSWMLVAQAPPLVREGRLHVVQPGVPGLVTLDAASGRMIWRLDDVSVSRIRGVARDALVVERIGAVATAGSWQPEQADVIGVDAATGKTIWRFGPADLLDAGLVTDDDILVAVREPVVGKNTRAAALVRLDPATGRETRRWPLGGCEDPHPFLGPLLPAAGGLRGFFGRGPGEPTRELLLIAP